MFNQPSPITAIINHLSDTTVSAAFYGSIGYLAARVAKEIDPKASLIYGATLGAIFGIFQAKHANTSSYIISGAASVTLPIWLCKKFELPATQKLAVIVTAVCFATRMIFLMIDD